MVEKAVGEKACIIVPKRVAIIAEFLKFRQKGLPILRCSPSSTCIDLGMLKDIQAFFDVHHGDIESFPDII